MKSPASCRLALPIYLSNKKSRRTIESSDTKTYSSLQSTEPRAGTLASDFDPAVTIPSISPSQPPRQSRTPSSPHHTLKGLAQKRGNSSPPPISAPFQPRALQSRQLIQNTQATLSAYQLSLLFPALHPAPSPFQPRHTKRKKKRITSPELSST